MSVRLNARRLRPLLDLLKAVLRVRLPFAAGGWIAGAALLGCMPLATAQTGTVTVSGTVNATTCTLTTTPALVAGSMAVPLPTVSTQTLSAVGATAGRVMFKVSLSSCSADGMASVYFYNNNPSINASGRLNSNVTGVDLEILNASGTPLNLSQSTAALQNSTAFAVSAGSGGTSYSVQYRSTSTTPSAGAVSASQQFLVSYP